MARNKLRGKYIEKVTRVDSKTVHIVLNNGDKIELRAEMVDYDDCELIGRRITKSKEDY